MAKLLSLEATLDLTSKGFENGIKNAEKLGKSLLGKLGEIGKGAAKTAVSALEGIGKAALVASGAVTALGSSFIPLVKQAADAFGDYEQLVGGVQTLFKEDWEFVVQDANQAFATVGMSANQYMETATSFAASMVKSVGGNTYLAAQMTKTAMVDIADNVNKMGTSFESVEYAYKGFAKQNYTMLDNLKLGYGGTKKEMERLLKDADEINAKQGKITHYSMENFSDIVDAIHVVQKEMGITGTTAEEAKDTIQGSAASMRAAWQNVLTFLGDSKAKGKLVQAIRAFAETAKTYLGNLVPVIKTAVSNLPLLVRELAPDVAELIPDLISGVLPSIVDAGMNVGQALIDGVFKLLSPSKMTKLVGDIGKRVNINLTKLLGLKKDASFTDIVAAAADKLREAVAHIGGAAKVTIASLLGLVKSDGTVNIDPNDVTWTQIGIEIAKRVAEAPKLVKVGICHLLGLTTEGGDPITDADQVEWSDIAQEIIDKVQTASGVVKLALAALLGLTGANGDPITDADEVSWGDIAQSIIDNIKTAQKNTKGFLADLLGLKYDSVDDVSWGDIARGLIRNLKAQLGDVNLFGDILDVTVDGLTAIAEFASAIGLELVTYLSNPANIQAIADSLGTLVGGVLDDTLSTLGIDSNFQESFTHLFSSIGDLAEAIISLFFERDEETGQLRATELTQGLIKGISGTLDLIASTVQVIADVVGDFKNLPGWIAGEEDFMKGLQGWVKYGGMSYESVMAVKRAYDAKDYLESKEGQSVGARTFKEDTDTAKSNYTSISTDSWESFVKSVESLNGKITGNIANNGKTKSALYQMTVDGVTVSYNVQSVSIDVSDQELQALIINGLMQQLGVAKNFGGSGLTSGTPGNAKGLWQVPYDDYLTRLHRDEMVLTASQARDYREGGGMDSEAIVSAIGGLRNDIQNLKLVVGRKQFGKAVVDYSGKAMQDAIGRSEDATYAGYGWG